VDDRQPDLVPTSKEVLVPASGPDWWALASVPTGLTKIACVGREVREVNLHSASRRHETVGGRYVFHHMTYSSVQMGERGSGDELASSWPIHEVGRNADLFPQEAGRLLQANSALALTAGHIHPNGRETKAHLEFAFKLFPKGYKPEYKRSSLRLGNGIDIDVKPNQANQELHSYATLQEHTKIIAFEPHLQRGVQYLEAISGPQHPDAQLRLTTTVKQSSTKTTRRCAEGTNRSPWPGHALPAKNPADPGWAGGGRRSIATCSPIRPPSSLSEGRFRARWRSAARR
jgi:hypothetical protein